MSAQRTLSIFIDELAIEDGALPPPRVGSITHLALSFSERVPDGYDATTIRAPLDPDRPPSSGGSHDSRWSGLLRGDGWTASWSGSRPIVGQQELTGWFRHMYDDCHGGARGRVTRIRLATMEYRASGHTPPRWEPTPGRRVHVRTELDAAPRFFERGRLLDPDVEEGATTSRGIGVVIDLDLDDVPALPPRPRVVPGDVSACGDVVWVLDRELPVAVRLDADRSATEHLLPGPIRYAHKRILATPTGCWVVGADGIYRCTVGETARRVDGNAVTAGAVIGETLLACRADGAWTLSTPDDDPVAVDAPPGFVSSAIEHRGQFLVSVVATFSNADLCTEYRLVQVSETGDVVIGPTRFGEQGSPGAPVLGGDPTSVVAGRDISSIDDDLGSGTVMTLSRMHCGGGRAGRYLWTVCHPSDGPGCTGRWTEAGPNTGTVPRQYWVLELLDPSTLQLVRAVPVFTSQPAVTEDGVGNIWIVSDGLRVVADGLRVVGEDSMQPPELIDLETMLSATERSS